MVESAVVVQWFTVAEGVATVALVFLLWKTLKQLEETTKLSRVQVTHRFRPWVGPSGGIEFMRTTEGKEQYVIRMKNYGEIPATNVEARFTMKNEMLDRNIVKNSDVTDNFNLGPLLPNMEKRYWFFIDSDMIQRAKNNAADIFIALYFAYEFGGGSSGYGMISHYDASSNTFLHKEMWVD